MQLIIAGLSLFLFHPGIYTGFFLQVVRLASMPNDILVLDTAKLYFDQSPSWWTKNDDFNAKES